MYAALAATGSNIFATFFNESKLTELCKAETCLSGEAISQQRLNSHCKLEMGRLDFDWLPSRLKSLESSHAVERSRMKSNEVERSRSVFFHSELLLYTWNLFLNMIKKYFEMFKKYFAIVKLFLSMMWEFATTLLPLPVALRQPGLRLLKARCNLQLWAWLFVFFTLSQHFKSQH